MVEEVRHPRLLWAFRATLYLCAALLATLLALVGVAAIGTILLLGGIAVVTSGDVNVLAVGGYTGLVVVVVALALAALTLGVRYVERRVRRADRLPDPLDELKREYVDDALDERELEHRLDGLLDAASDHRDGTQFRGRTSGVRAERTTLDDEETA